MIFCTLEKLTDHFGQKWKSTAKKWGSITGAFTRAEKTRAASTCNTSAITKCMWSENHVIDCDNVKVIYRESDKTGRLIRKAVWIRKSNNKNWDEGANIWATFGTSYLVISETKSVLMKTSSQRSKRQSTCNMYVICLFAICLYVWIESRIVTTISELCKDSSFMFCVHIHKVTVM